MNAVALFSVNMCSLSALPVCGSHVSKERAEWVTGPDRETFTSVLLLLLYVWCWVGVVCSTGFPVRGYYSVAPLLVNQLSFAQNQPILQAFQVSGRTVFMTASLFCFESTPPNPSPSFVL